MAHFNLKSNRARGNDVSVSDPSSVYINGWHSGVNVELRETTDGDVFYIWLTAGSDSQQHVHELLGVVKTADNSPVFFDHKGRQVTE